jgi:hypothetical protein
MAEYVLNKRSNVLHKLPASESCNTDQIQYKLRWSGANDEEIVAYQVANTLQGVTPCRRCFRG